MSTSPRIEWFVATAAILGAAACASAPTKRPHAEAKPAVAYTLAVSTPTPAAPVEEVSAALDSTPPLDAVEESHALRGGPMIPIPAGKYWTGCDLGHDTHCRTQDGPFRQVELGSYRIDKFEVTVGDYKACVSEGTCSAKGVDGTSYGQRAVYWMNCNWNRPNHDDHPLNCVSWKQADTFCKWAGKRLPTEAEWEKAARGTDQRTYPWGDEMITCEYAVTNLTGDGKDKGCGLNDTMPVGSKPKGASPYGVMDIVGNVWEWTADEFAPVKGEPMPDPSEEQHHKGKGGCWGSGNPWNSRISWSHHYAANYGGNVRLGFRCAADAEPEAHD